MAEFYRFFDSTIDDIREYTADEFSEYFRMVLTNGIYNGGTNLQVVAGGGDMTVDIEDGYANIYGYLYKVLGGVTLPIETADVTHNRIDRIVLRWDKREESRFIKAMVLKGVAAEQPVPPELTRTDDIHELSLAQVLVKAGTNNISGDAVTDERLNTEVCGLINSLIQADTTEIFKQFQAWYNEKIPSYEKQWNDWYKEQSQEGFILAKEKGTNNGVATLDGNGKIPLSQLSLPDMVASNVAISDSANLYTATTVENALQEVMNKANSAFQSASDGKTKIATAITGVDNSISISSSASFQELSNAIARINTGVPFPPAEPSGGYYIKQVTKTGQYWMDTSRTKGIESDHKGTILKTRTCRTIGDDGYHTYEYTNSQYVNSWYNSSGTLIVKNTTIGQMCLGLFYQDTYVVGVTFGSPAYWVIAMASGTVKVKQTFAAGTGLPTYKLARSADGLVMSPDSGEVVDLQTLTIKAVTPTSNMGLGVWGTYKQYIN